MSGIKFTEHSYKVQSKKRLKDGSSSGKLLRNLVYVENMLVMNDAQFRHFYKAYTMHDLIGGDSDDIDCMKMQVCKELLSDLVQRINERGEFIEREQEQERVQAL